MYISVTGTKLNERKIGAGGVAAGADVAGVIWDAVKYLLDKLGV